MILEYIKRLFGVTQDNEGETKASVPFMVTQDMKRQLLDLGWPRHQVNIMKPALAHDIIEGGKTYKG